MARSTHWFFVVAVAALFASGCGSSAAPVAPSTASTSPSPLRRILVLGDSLAVSPSLAESFPAELRARIERLGLRWTVTNAGVSGDTTAAGMLRLEPLLAPDVGVLLLELGANDGLRGVDAASIETNLSTMIAAAQRRGIRVLLCGMETPPTHGLEYSVAFHFVFPTVAQPCGTARAVPAQRRRAHAGPERAGWHPPQCRRRSTYGRHDLAVPRAAASELRARGPAHTCRAITFFIALIRLSSRL